MLQYLWTMYTMLVAREDWNMDWNSLRCVKIDEILNTIRMLHRYSLKDNSKKKRVTKSSIQTYS